MNLHVIHCGTSDYRHLWEVQRRLWRSRVDGSIGDCLLLTEHNHVYTLGKTADPNHLLAQRRLLGARGIDVLDIDRGGGITYHGPGQLVAYPILALDRWGSDMHEYLRMLERSIIGMLSQFGIDGTQDEEFTGVWVRNEKLASIGIKVAKWVTMHGAAINVQTDLSYFNDIIACGIFHRGMTSMRAQLGHSLAMTAVEDAFVASFCDIFSLEAERVALADVLHDSEPVSTV